MKATPELIKKAYKNMALMYHPDKVMTLGPKLREVATEEMKKINCARSVLLDKQKRKKYDVELGLRKEKARQQSKNKWLIVNEALKMAKKYLARVRYVKGDSSEAENFYIQAIHAKKNGDPQLALEMAGFAKREAKSILYMFTVDILVLTKNRLKSLQNKGFDVQEAMKRFGDAKIPFERNQYIEAMNVALESIKMAKKIAKTQTSSDINANEILSEIGNIMVKSPSDYVAKWNEEERNRELHIYRNVLEDVWADGIVTQDEMEHLGKLKEKWSISEQEHKELEGGVRGQRKKNIMIYLKALERTFEDGVVDEDERKMLKNLRQKLNLKNVDI